MADLKISELPALSGSLLQADDPLAIDDLSASETKKITAKDLVQGGVALIDAGSIPGDKVNLTLSPGSIGTVELADGSVTAPKLADNSSGVVDPALPAAGAYIGQLAVETTTNKAYIWNGGAWVAFAGAGSINSLTYDNNLGPIAIGGVQTGDNIELGVAPKDTTAPSQFMAGPAGAAGAVNYRNIESVDLPTASATGKGAIRVDGFGLKVDGDRLEINNAVAASVTYGVVTYNAQGLVTDGRAIEGTDLPLATETSPGVVQIGPQFGTLAGGVLIHSNSVAAGSSAKVQFDSSGHITAALPQTEADIPDLPASKITSGTFPTARLADRSVTAAKLADYSTTYIQDTQPPVTGNFIGQLWLNPLAQQIRCFDGNVWVPIGVGALSEQNLRFCGTVNANTGLITILTPFGVDAGFAVGSPIPTETEQLTGAYFVVDEAGNGIGVTTGVNYDPGDWCLCYGLAQGWGRIDTLNAGGGGGGSLDSLADVTIASPVTGQFLGYNGTQWVNSLLPEASLTVKGVIQLASQAEVDAGTNTLKAVTPATLATYVANEIPHASETERGIIQLATAAEVEAGTDAEKAVTPLQLATYYMPRDISSLPDLP